MSVNKPTSHVINATTLASQASAELSAAAAAITAGDESLGARTEQIRRLVSAVGGASLQSLSRAAQLHQDDVMNPGGKQRLLAALPGELRAATDDILEQADILVDVVEGRHLEALLHHDSRQDANLIAELNNYTANLAQSDAAAVLASLAANTRYSTFLAGPMGESLRARFGIKDEEFFRRIGLEALAIAGTPAQQARAAALQEVPKLRRAIGLIRGARDAAMEEVQRPPAREPSQAMQ